jgi:uncharacterized lipoprotein YehR (DUF1307 family)
MKIKLFTLCVALVMSMALAACGNDPADALLDDLEKIVVKYEDLAKKDAISADDFTAFSKEAQEFSTKFTNTGSIKYSESQTKRAGELTTRFSTAFQNLASKVK